MPSIGFDTAAVCFSGPRFVLPGDRLAQGALALHALQRLEEPYSNENRRWQADLPDRAVGGVERGGQRSVTYSWSASKNGVRHIVHGLFANRR